MLTGGSRGSSRATRIERMFAAQDPPAPVDPYSAEAVAAIDALAGDDPARLDVAGQLLRLRTVSRLVDRLEAERIRLLGVADRSGALDQDGAATASAWLQRNSTLTTSQADTRVKLAQRLPQLPVISTAFARGSLGLNHVSLILGLCRDVGIDNVAALQVEIVQVSARLHHVEDFMQMCRRWRQALRPDAADAAADDREYQNHRTTALGPIRSRR
jgi:hypothetical protein